MGTRMMVMMMCMGTLTRCQLSLYVDDRPGLMEFSTLLYVLDKGGEYTSLSLS